MTPQKSTVDEIRARFDADVDRFSNLETGQSATVDATLAMSLVAQAAALTTPQAQSVLDIGCGAGNYTLKLLEYLPGVNASLVDLSRPMLDRAVERISSKTSGSVEPIQSDIRDLALADEHYDIILAAAVLHHLRSDDEWNCVFRTLFRTLRPGGSLWIFDLVESSIPAVQAMQWHRYGEYLTSFRDDTYRDHVFAYIDREDTPRPLMFQLDLLRQVGFTRTDILHKNSCFAAFGAVK
ncbi:MAG: class I SAM-dependent methyltransferase [Planctomycetota bacterium]|nr:class I SAM-dependent methyltransferase [Planctomycetota bacterium]